MWCSGYQTMKVSNPWKTGNKWVKAYDCQGCFLGEGSRLWTKEGGVLSEAWGFPGVEEVAWGDEGCQGSLSSQSTESEERELHREKIVGIFRISSWSLQQNTDQHINKLPKSQKRTTQMDEREPSQGKDRKEVVLFPSLRVKSYVIQGVLDRELNHFAWNK